MQGAVTGILYARLARRNLIIDWSDKDYSGDGSNVFPRLFACPSVGGLDIPDTDSVAPPMWQGRLRQSVYELQATLDALGVPGHLSIDLTTLGHVEDVVVTCEYTQQVKLLKRHFRREFDELRGVSAREILKTLLREELVPQPTIQARIDEFRARHLHHPTVGVHLRWSDRRVRVRAILRELDRVLAREPELTIFVATDNIKAKAMLERRHRRVITLPHWYPAPGKRLHGNRDCPNPFESAVEALIDLHLLASCEHLIGDSSASTFFRVAAWHRPSGMGNVIDLKPTKRIDRILADEWWCRYAESESTFSGIALILLRAARLTSPIAGLPARVSPRRWSLPRPNR
jgi:hypothetical protein